jgi:hypothetical protein
MKEKIRMRFKKISSRKKIIYAVLILALVIEMATFLHLSRSKKSAKKSPEKENSASAPYAKESLRGKLEEGQDVTDDEKTKEDAKLAKIAAENSGNEVGSGQENSQADQKTSKNSQDEEEIPPAEIGIKVISRGAPSGEAEKIRSILKSAGYDKSVIGGEKKEDIVQVLIFFREDKFRIEAESIAQLLIEKDKIFSYARKASSAEEKSADILIILGKSKEAPPN